MQIYPAIDLREGKCVRLSQGDFTRSTVYDDDPVAVARKFLADGAHWLHLVDLDGAKDPTCRQSKLIIKLIASSPLKIQTGGGVRSKGDVEDLLALGASRVIIGSLTIKQPDVVMRILDAYGPDRIVLALDVRSRKEDHLVATDGWQATSSQRVADVIKHYGKRAHHVLCTDICRDGGLAGPNIDLYRSLRHAAPDLQIQASGGVGTLEDLALLRQAGVAAVVVGKALYERRFTFAQALEEHGHAR